MFLYWIMCVFSSSHFFRNFDILQFFSSIFRLFSNGTLENGSFFYHFLSIQLYFTFVLLCFFLNLWLIRQKMFGIEPERTKSDNLMAFLWIFSLDKVWQKWLSGGGGVFFLIIEENRINDWSQKVLKETKVWLKSPDDVCLWWYFRKIFFLLKWIELVFFHNWQIYLCVWIVGFVY